MIWDNIKFVRYEFKIKRTHKITILFII